MSQQPINRSPDLKKLQDEGYDVRIQANHLVVDQVPYLDSRKEVKYGALVSTLNLAGNKTTTPDTHVVSFAGEHPCNIDGSPISTIKHQSATQSLGDGLVVDHSFSSKPAGGYGDYYEKMTTYVAIIASPAQSVDPTATARTFPVIQPDEDESVFQYLDTASSRAQINNITNRLALNRIGIVGLGGTGSYVLDLVAKTPAKEIHLFDQDRYIQHNAFRSPGAPSAEELQQRPQKVAYFQALYSKMHRNIIAHDVFIDASNLHLIEGMDFVFLCLDDGQAKKILVDKLEASDIPFVDTGIGVQVSDESLHGIVRVTTSTAHQRDHVHEKSRIPFANGPANNEYSRNIQIADLNALNAALAVIKWKKLCGFYLDLENEHFSAYTIDGNGLINEDRP